MKSAFSNWFGDFSFESSDEPLWNFNTRTQETKAFFKSKQVFVIVEGGELRGEILVFKIYKEDELNPHRNPSISYEIRIKAFDDVSISYCREEFLINELKSAEDRLVETLKKGKQPTILDELAKLGYK